MNEVKKPRGLAALSPERRKEIATMGGKTKPAKGKGFASMTPERRLEIATMGGIARQKKAKESK